ncbi:MAG: TetR/AcrR family transcriptional regulator [Rubricoccaceae bacterium]
MARPKTFSPDAALAAALEVFRCSGYEATSVQDLVDATGLSRSSLYATFGDKHALYLAALDRYRQHGREHLARALDGSRGASPLCAIQTYLEAVAAEQGDGDAPPMGCLLTNAAAEVASRDPETARRARESATQIAEAFACAVEQAQALGEITPDRDAVALGRFLSATVFGIRGLQNANASPEVLADVVELAMESVSR